MKGVADAETASVEVNQEGNFLRLRGSAIWKVEARGHAAVEGDHQALEGDTSGVGGIGGGGVDDVSVQEAVDVAALVEGEELRDLED